MINRKVNGHQLTPEYEYFFDLFIKKRNIVNIIDIGAREFNQTSFVMEQKNCIITPNPATEIIEINLARKWKESKYSTPLANRY